MLSALAAGLGLYALAALAGLAGRRCLVAVYLTATAAAGVIALAALWALIEATAPVSAVLPLGLPWLGAHFRVDALSAFFLLVVNGAGVLISVYAISGLMAGFGADRLGFDGLILVSVILLAVALIPLGRLRASEHIVDAHGEAGRGRAAAI